MNLFHLNNVIAIRARSGRTTKAIRHQELIQIEITTDMAARLAVPSSSTDTVHGIQFAASGLGFPMSLPFPSTYLHTTLSPTSLCCTAICMQLRYGVSSALSREARFSHMQPECPCPTHSVEL